MSTNPAAALHTEDLSLDFGGLRVLDNLTLTVQAGARHALIGPNGAGKTSLMHLLAGLYRPSSGRIHLAGEDVTALPCDARARRGLGRSFQINQLFPSLTPLSCVVMAIGERQELSASWWRPVAAYPHVLDEAHALLQRLRLAALAHTPVAHLAYGQQRLLEIALALASGSRILLLDEPGAGLPQDEIGELLAVLQALPAALSILLIEHDMRLVFAFAQRISVLANGRLLAEGSAEDIAANPLVQAVYLGT